MEKPEATILPSAVGFVCKFDFLQLVSQKVLFGMSVCQTMFPKYIALNQEGEDDQLTYSEKKSISSQVSSFKGVKNHLFLLLLVSQVCTLGYIFRAGIGESAPKSFGKYGTAKLALKCT